MMKWLRSWLCKSPLKGWGKQSTKEGFNGDIIAGKSIVMITHTNPIYTASTEKTHKENRVEIHKEIKENNYDWVFNVNFHKLPVNKDWVIFSQLWNLTHDNVICLVVTNLGRGKIKLQLNKKQNKVTSGLWAGEFNQHDKHKIDLKVTHDHISGTINNIDVGNHELEIFTKEPTSIKYGLYWSGKIPFNNKNRIVAEYEL